VEVVASLSQGRTAAVQCGLFTHNQSRSYLNHLVHCHITLGPQVYIIIFRYCNIKAQAGMEPYKSLLPTLF